MSRPTENPIYDDGAYDEVEGELDDDVAEIQPDPSAATITALPINVAAPPPNFTGQRFTPPPTPPAKANAQRVYGASPFRPPQQQDPRRQF